MPCRLKRGSSRRLIEPTRKCRSSSVPVDIVETDHGCASLPPGSRFSITSCRRDTDSVHWRLIPGRRAIGRCLMASVQLRTRDAVNARTLGAWRDPNTDDGDDRAERIASTPHENRHGPTTDFVLQCHSPQTEGRGRSLDVHSTDSNQEPAPPQFFGTRTDWGHNEESTRSGTTDLAERFGLRECNRICPRPG